jgi:class 3 adenylate cyclase/tetratricopeptide (TPR) repeat protein
MQCPKCHYENPNAAKFCGRCGARLELSCPHCDTRNPPQNQFCQECGQPLTTVAGGSARPRFASPRSYTPSHLAEKILAGGKALEGERKQVTVLFTDVSGFTSMSEKLDPEEVHVIMEQYFDLLLEQVHRYEGTINQFLGDGIMALFGAPIAHEDHAQRAVLAALSIQKALQVFQRELADQKGIQFRVRTGLNTGLVVVGAISDNLKMDYTAVGDPVNVASRMLTLAQPGQVVIAEDTHKLTASYFVMQSLGEQSVKGKSQPVKAYQVVRAREFRTRIDVELERGFSPFVGRENELAVFRERFAEVKSGKGQIVFEIGEPGVGKSRLLFEFRRLLEGEEYLWLTGRCISFGSQIAYLPILDILKRYLQVEEEDDEAAVIAKTEQGMEALGEEMRAAIPYFKQLLSVNPGDETVAKMDAQIRRLKTFEGLRALMWKLAELKPLVLVVEDLHWMDKASEELLLYLADSCAAARVLLILTHRPGYENPFGDRSYTTRQVLNRLSDQESIRLAKGMLATTQFPVELQALITRKAEGNPFFVEEVIKSMVETGALQRQNGHYVVARSLAEIQVPDTVQDVIMGRIDRLAESPKKALQLAAVIGREFTVSLLDRVADLKGQLGKLLQDLKVLELIYERSLFPELAYMFKHALTQDVAYSSLLMQRRKELHRLVGLAIEELYAERLVEYYEMLAYHYERGEVYEKALEYYVKAAEKSQRASANQGAIEQYSRALEVSRKLGTAVQPATLLAIYIGKAQAHFTLGDFRHSIDAYQLALAACSASGDGFREVQALAGMADSLLWAHEFEKCAETAEKARMLAVERGYKDLEACTLRTLGGLRAMEGRLTEATSYLLDAVKLNLDVFESIGVHPLSYLALIKGWSGDFSSAHNFASNVVSSAQSRQSYFDVLTGTWNQGLHYCGRGEYTHALSSLRDALELSSRLGSQFLKCRILNSFGWVYLELFDTASAVRYNTEGLELSRKLGDPEIIRNAELNLGDCYLLLNDLHSGEQYLEKVYRDSQQRGKWGEEWMKWRYMQRCCHSLGELRLRQGDLAKALELADECLKLAESTTSRKNIVKGCRLRGQVFLAQDKLPEAEVALEKALAVAKEIGNPPQLWKTYEALAALFERKGEFDKAKVAYASALEVIDGVAARLQESKLRETFLSAAPVKQLRAKLAPST